MKDEHIRVVMMPVKVTSYTDEFGKTRVGRVEHPTIRSVEQWIDMEPFMNESSGGERLGRGTTISIGNDGRCSVGRRMLHRDFLFADLIVDMVTCEIIKDRNEEQRPVSSVADAIDRCHRAQELRRSYMKSESQRAVPTGAADPNK